MDASKNVYRISLWDDFTCLADQCPETCCRGWKIAIDDDTQKLYDQEKGLFGLLLKAKLPGQDGNINYFSGRCPYYNLQHLCTLQKRLGRKYQPKVCREYPRCYVRYGQEYDEFLSCSCIQVSKLLLSCDDFGMNPVVDDYEFEIGGTNEDLEYFEMVKRSKYELIAVLRNFYDQSQTLSAKGFVKGLSLVLSGIFDYAKAAQDHVISGDFSFFSDEDESVSHFCNEALDDPDQARALFPMKLSTLNDTISAEFMEDGLRDTLPFLYDLCDIYYKRFGDMTEAEGDQAWPLILEDFMDRNEALRSAVIKMITYIFECYYLETFEDYSFLRRVTETILQVNLFALLTYVYEYQIQNPDVYNKLFKKRSKRTGSDQLTIEDMAHVMSVVDRRFRHNIGLRHNMTDIVIKSLQ